MAKPKPEKKTKAATVIPHRLKGFIERIERLIEERDAIAGDIKDVFAEAKGVGYDIKTMRKVIQLRAMDAADRAEMETLLDVYLNALGMADRIVSAVQAGATYREAADAEGTSATKVHRLVTKTRGKNEPHESEQADPSTGEVIESPTAGVEPPVPGAAEQAPSIEANEAGSSAANPSTSKETNDGHSDFRDGSRSGTPEVQPECQGRGDGDQAADRLAGHHAGGDRPAQRQDGDRGRDGGDPARPDGEHVGGLRGDKRALAAVAANGASTKIAARPPAGTRGEDGPAPIFDTDESCGGVDGHASVVTQPRAPGLDGRAAPAVATGEGAGSQSGPHDTESSDGVEVRHAEARNTPGYDPGEDQSSAPSRLVGSSVREAAIVPCAGVTPSSEDTRTWDEIVPPIDPRLDRRRATA